MNMLNASKFRLVPFFTISKDEAQLDQMYGALMELLKNDKISVPQRISLYEEILNRIQQFKDTHRLDSGLKQSTGNPVAVPTPPAPSDKPPDATPDNDRGPKRARREKKPPGNRLSGRYSNKPRASGPPAPGPHNPPPTPQGNNDVMQAAQASPLPGPSSPLYSEVAATPPPVGRQATRRPREVVQEHTPSPQHTRNDTLYGRKSLVGNQLEKLDKRPKWRF